MQITADLVHNGIHFLPEGTTLVINNGTISEILAAPTADTVHYKGILAPGFVNAHCHLELSHTRGMVPEHMGLIEFLKSVSLNRNSYTTEQKEQARQTALNELVSNGVVAVGDIANTTDTLDLREQGKLHFHTFVEALGFTPANAGRAFGYALSNYNAFSSQKGETQLRQSIIPHAPYSVSAELFKAINEHNSASLLSIHNQESTAENDFYMRHEGGVRDLLSALGIDDSFFKPTGKSSMLSYMDWLSPGRQYMFVHNTYTTRPEVRYIETHFNAHWCLCPNANLYIENRLPDLQMFIDEGVNICVGTDSLASNHQLSVLAELATIKQHYQTISWETLLKWGTSNGASALGMRDIVGTIEVGKRPGVVQLTGLDQATTHNHVNLVVSSATL